MQQDGRAGDGLVAERCHQHVAVDDALRSGLDDDDGDVHDLAERDAGQVAAVGVAVVRRVQVRAGVADHAEPIDLECRP